MKKLLLLFVALIAVKVFLSFSFPSPWVFGDAAIYTAKTRAIISEGNFNFDKYHYGGPRVPPLYSVTLIPAYFFDEPDANHRAILLINAILSSLLIFPIFWIARKHISETAALLLGLLAGVWPSGFGYSFMVMAENVFIPLLAFSGYFLYQSFRSKNIRWDVLLGFALGALYLTKVTGIFPVAAWFAIRFLYVFSAKNHIRYVARTVVTLICAALPIFWWLIVKEGSDMADASGYNTSAYLAAAREILSSFVAFKEALRLGFNQLAYYIVAGAFIFVPLAIVGNLVLSKRDGRFLRDTAPLLGYTIVTSLLFAGASVLHQYIFLEKLPERYLLFGRYIEATLPLFFLIGGIVLFRFRRSTPLRLRLYGIVFVLLAAVFAVMFLPGTLYDIVNNISLLYVRGVDVRTAFPVLWVWLLFACVAILLYPQRFLRRLLILGIAVFFTWTYVPAFGLSVEPSETYAKKIAIPAYVNDVLPYGTVVGFDADQIWEKDLMQYFWLYEFWFGKKYHLLHTPQNDFHGAYFITWKNLPYPILAAERETPLKLYQLP